MKPKKKLQEDYPREEGKTSYKDGLKEARRKRRAGECLNPREAKMLVKADA